MRELNNEKLNSYRSVDVLIPTYRPGEKFVKLLDMLASQTVLPERVIIANTEESLFTGDAAEAFRRLNTDASSPLYGRLSLRHITRAEFDHAGTRNLLASLSKSEAFICMTDDAVPEDCLLIEKLETALYGNGNATASAYARQLAGKDSDEAENYTRRFNYPEEGFIKAAGDLKKLGIKLYFCPNVCCIYRRDVFEKLGGFSEPAVFNEDMVYAHAVIEAGYEIAYAADAKVVHSHNYSAMQQLHRNFDLGMSQALHPEVFGNVRSEGEGIRLVKETTLYLIKKGKLFSVPGMLVKSAFKYLGYKLGKNYGKLPDAAVLKLTMNRSFTEKYII